MKLADLLVDSWVAAPLSAGNLEEALHEVLLRVHGEGLMDEARATAMARDLADGSQGEVVRVNEDVVAVLGTLEALERPAIGVGVADEPFAISALEDEAGKGEEGDEGADRARAVVVILAPGKLTAARQQILPTVARILRDPSRTETLVGARAPSDVRGIKELMEAEYKTQHLVADALTPVRYRVYPDTPVREVLDLMVRRGIHAVPVVGEQYEVLGILTSGDALEHLIHHGKPEESDEEGDAEKSGGTPAARDVMTRTVLCVSEDQGLMDAANMMVNRDVEQLPVVREGELVGFVTRDTILRVLLGAPPGAPTAESEERESESD